MFHTYYQLFSELLALVEQYVLTAYALLFLTSNYTLCCPQIIPYLI